MLKKPIKLSYDVTPFLSLDRAILAMLTGLAFAGKGPSSDGGWVSLFQRQRPFRMGHLPGAAYRQQWERRISDQPVGLNNDPRHVFTVVTDGGGEGHPHLR
jgi:hypothetical protein